MDVRGGRHHSLLGTNKGGIRGRFNHWLAGQSPFSLMSSALSLLLVAVFLSDIIFRGHPNLRLPLAVTWMVLCGGLTLVPLLMGRRYPRWAGLVMVLIMEGWSVIVLVSGGHTHAEMNVLLQMPPVALYLGWFFALTPALVCLVLGIARGMLAFYFGLHLEPGTISPPIVVGYAVLISVFCFFGARVVRTQSVAQLSTDQLTGVLNRRGVTFEGERRLRGALQKGDTWVVALIDLDDFKAVNDRGGHAAGDALLKSEALRLRATLGPGSGGRGRDGIIGRLGGDEFVLGRRGTLSSIQRDLETLRTQGTVAWSWGAVQVAAGEGLADAIVRADAELYRAKRLRRTVE